MIISNIPCDLVDHKEILIDCTDLRLLYCAYAFCSKQRKYDLAAAVTVGRKEMWRRRAIWDRVKDFRSLTGIPITSPIISLIIGSEDKALEASQLVSSLNLFSVLCLNARLRI